MSDESDSEYVCTLTDFSLKKAIKELNEDPNQRLGSVQTLRKWILEQPHFTCRTDTKFLLAILRRAKFSQLVARQLIDNILTIRTKHPKVTVNYDTQDPCTLAYIDAGVFLYLPKKDKDGRTIILARLGANNLDDPRFTSDNEVRTLLMLSELYRDEDENMSVNGTIIVVDLTGAGMKYMNYCTLDQRKTAISAFQDCNPERVKGILVYNAGPVLEMFMGIMKAFMKKKLMDRVSVHSTMESLFKVIPMDLWPVEYLPDDYKGPSAGSISSSIADMNKRMMNAEARQRILSYTSDRYKIDEKKRPSGPGIIPNESFRKLNID